MRNSIALRTTEYGAKLAGINFAAVALPLLKRPAKTAGVYKAIGRVAGACALQRGAKSGRISLEHAAAYSSHPSTNPLRERIRYLSAALWFSYNDCACDMRDWTREPLAGVSKLTLFLDLQRFTYFLSLANVLFRDPARQLRSLMAYGRLDVEATGRQRPENRGLLSETWSTGTWRLAPVIFTFIFCKHFPIQRSTSDSSGLKTESFSTLQLSQSCCLPSRIFLQTFSLRKRLSAPSPAAVTPWADSPRYGFFFKTE